MAKAEFNIGPINTWINNIKGEIAQEAAEAIIIKLQIEGPYWTGNFAGAWEARLGNVDIPADQESLDRNRDLGVDASGKAASQLETYVVEEAPKKSKKLVQYSIDNRMVYREIAKDLEPDSTGTYRKERENITARPDWYVRYLQGGGLATTLALATNRVSKDPAIQNYKA